MTTYAFPTLARRVPSDWTFGQRSNCRIHTSPLSGQVQTVELPGARWLCSLRYRNLLDPDRGLIEAFFAKLRGQANRFTIYDFTKPVPQGTMRGSPVTSGSTAAGATAFTISAGGGQANTTLVVGDKLNVGGELKIVVAAVTLNGSGVGTVTVEPPFRSTIGGGSAVAWDRPTAVFMAVNTDWVAEFTAASMADYVLDAVEVFS